MDFAFSAQDETTTAATTYLDGGEVDGETMSLASMAKIADHYALFGDDYKDQMQTLLGE